MSIEHHEIRAKDRLQLCPSGVSQEFSDRFKGLVEAMLEYMDENPSPYFRFNFIAYKCLPESDVPIAFHHFYFGDSQGRLTCELWSVYVDEPFRSQGIAFELLRHAVAFSYSKGVRRFILKFTSTDAEGGKLVSNLRRMKEDEFADCVFEYNFPIKAEQ